jgi:hypothetical protein
MKSSNNSTANTLKQITLMAYSENKENKKFDENDLKLMIDSSIYGMFGILEANKLKYSIKKEDNMKYILKTYEK